MAAAISTLAAMSSAAAIHSIAAISAAIPPSKPPQLISRDVKISFL